VGRGAENSEVDGEGGMSVLADPALLHRCSSTALRLRLLDHANLVRCDYRQRTFEHAQPSLRDRNRSTSAGPEPTRKSRRRISKAAWFECCSDKGEKEGIKKRGQS
jgi:hypothetical protein